MKTIFVAALTALLLWSSITFSTDFQSHESIHAAALALIDKMLPTNVEHEITFAPLDKRLQLNVCEHPLETAINTHSIKPGRNSIGVKCNGVKSWSLYVSAQVKIYQDVILLKQAVQRGEILTADHLQVTRLDISPLRGPAIQGLNNAISKQAARNLPKDTILSERDVVLAILIKRGENVVITSANPKLVIQMQGLALMDGVQGQKIRIKNITSGRIISATVTKPGEVAVAP